MLAFVVNCVHTVMTRFNIKNFQASLEAIEAELGTVDGV